MTDIQHTKAKRQKTDKTPDRLLPDRDIILCRSDRQRLTAEPIEPVGKRCGKGQQQSII